MALTKPPRPLRAETAPLLACALRKATIHAHSGSKRPKVGAIHICTHVFLISVSLFIYIYNNIYIYMYIYIYVAVHIGLVYIQTNKQSYTCI